MTDQPRAEGGVVETPDYEPVTDGLALVRRFGSGAVHLAAVKPEWLVAAKWIGPPYWALLDPVATLCGAVLYPDRRGLVVMHTVKDGMCRRCERNRHG